MASRYIPSEAQDAVQAIRDVQARTEGNNFCADCGHPRPEFINITIGTFICQLCAEVHRSLSNRQIKDIYAGDLTFQDVRRMEAVGNDTANGKFLATWDPRQVPEPDRRVKDSLREFIWLKYEGSFKRQKPPTQPARQAPPVAYNRTETRYYDDRVSDGRTRAGYRREHDLFRDQPLQAQERPRGYWSSRYETPAERMPPPQPNQSLQMQQVRPRDDYYSRAPPPAPAYPDRYRPVSGSDRFHPPQPTQVTQYTRFPRNPRGRYQEVGMPYEDYASFNSEERDFGMRRAPSSRARRSENEGDLYEYGDGDGEVGRVERKGKSSKSKSKARRKKNLDEEFENENDYSEEEADEEEEPYRGEKKRGSKKSKKSTKSKRRVDVEEEEEEEEEDEDYEEEEEADDDYGIDVKKSKRHGKKSGKRAERDRDSVVTVDVADEVGSASVQAPTGEFDLMSEWMGESKETNSSEVVPPAPNNGMPTSGPMAAAMQQAYATQVPMIPPPMSIYGGMMPLPGGGFMPMMPNFMGGMGMPGMPPGMPQQGVPPGMPPGMSPGMPPVMPLGMMGMGGPGAPAVSPSAQPVQGLVNGMQGLNLNHHGGQPAVAGAHAQPPPPPPVGMPAGPPPGPPPEPPLSS